MHCIVCQEDDPSVILRCGDGIVRCAHHANEAGYCWGCGKRKPVFTGDEGYDGMCFPCRAEDKARWQRRQKRAALRPGDTVFWGSHPMSVDCITLRQRRGMCARLSFSDGSGFWQEIGRIRPLTMLNAFETEHD